MVNSSSFSGFDYYNALFFHTKMNAVLLIDPNGIILETNDAFGLSFGYTEDDIVGQHFSVLFSDADKKKDLPEREIRMVLDTGQSFDNNYMVNKDKKWTWVSGESVLITNDKDQKCILKIIQNIHSQKESEHSIIRLNHFNENILGSILDAVIVIDNEFEILKANRSFTQLFNFSDQEVAKIDFKSFISKFDVNSELYNAISNIFQTSNANSKVQLDIDFAGAEPQTFDIGCTILAEEGEQTRVLLIFHDITAQKQVERQREDIMNFVAHEFKNPLTNVMLSIELVDAMLKEKGLSEFNESMQLTRNNARKLNKLIDELYKSTKLISGNFDPERSLFDLDEMMDEAIQSTRQLFKNRSIVKTGIANVSLSADRDKISQVLTNYLTNAIKYSDVNDGIEVSSKIENEIVIVSVKDSGKGIPEKDLPLIFNRFYRAPEAKSSEGLGLGLFLSKQIVAAHGGKTWVESEEGKGSIFFFSLDVAAS
jgi:PAS domain S-box-containing protein